MASDWSLGTPSYVYPGFGVHDAWIEADGTSVYFNCNVPNNVLTLGKFDLKTATFKPIRVAAVKSYGRGWHSLTRWHANEILLAPRQSA
jgi:hypothetical protein